MLTMELEKETDCKTSADRRITYRVGWKSGTIHHQKGDRGGSTPTASSSAADRLLQAALLPVPLASTRILPYAAAGFALAALSAGYVCIAMLLSPQ